MTIEIRTALPEDGATVAAMVVALSAHEGQSPPAFSAATFRRDGFGADRAFETLIAERDGVVVGYALFQPAYSTEEGVRGTYLCDLYVDPAQRRQGVAMALMAAVARAGARAGGAFLTWNALKSNTEASAFYGRVGRREDRVAHWSAHGEAFKQLVALAPDDINGR
jgi:ribosomal protein S18 acetylase RimI-like enzyme